MKVIEKITDALLKGSDKVVFSFEFFPPKTEDGMENLFEKMERMVAHNPTFCDITWRVGGPTTDLTLDIANRMQNMVCVETMMHLTCTNMLVENEKNEEEEEEEKEKEEKKKQKKKRAFSSLLTELNGNS